MQAKLETARTLQFNDVLNPDRVKELFRGSFVSSQHNPKNYLLELCNSIYLIVQGKLDINLMLFFGLAFLFPVIDES